MKKSKHKVKLKNPYCIVCRGNKVHNVVIIEAKRAGECGGRQGRAGQGHCCTNQVILTNLRTKSVSGKARNWIARAVLIKPSLWRDAHCFLIMKVDELSLAGPTKGLDETKPFLSDRKGSMKVTITPTQHKTLTHLPKRPPVDLAFSDLTYRVQEGRKSSKFFFFLSFFLLTKFAGGW